MFNCKECCCDCKCHEELTTIYSSESMQALETLMQCMLSIFDCEGRKLEDIIRYGVFCRADTYANFTGWDDAPQDLDIPDIMTADCSRPCERICYVNKVIESILNGDIEKPEWMIYVEMNDACEGVQPSTFLYITPVDEKYRCLSDSLVDFLYSPNKLTTMLEYDEC